MDRVEFHQQCVLGGIACGVVQEDDVAARTGVDQVTQDQFADAARPLRAMRVMGVPPWWVRRGDGIDAGLEGQAAQAVEREFDESGDPAAQRGVGLGEDEGLFGLCPGCLDRVGQAPVTRDRLAGPGGAFLGRCRVADGEDEIHHGGVGLLEFGDVLGPQAGDVVAVAVKHVERKGIERRVGTRSGGKGLELVPAQIAQERLGKDRAGGVAGADEQDVEAHGGDLRDFRGGEEIRAGASDVECQVADERLGRVEVDGVVERAAMTFREDEARRGEVRQMVREGVWPEVQRGGYFGGADALRGKAHQEAEDRQTAGVAEGGECCGGAGDFHIS